MGDLLQRLRGDYVGGLRFGIELAWLDVHLFVVGGLEVGGDPAHYRCAGDTFGLFQAAVVLEKTGILAGVDPGAGATGQYDKCRTE
ncbi:hypothetical protein D3C76_1481670 [compost metagenome]